MTVKIAALAFSFAAFLIQAAPVNSQVETDRLLESIRHGDLSGMRSALKNGALINGRDKSGSTPLMYTALYMSDTTAMHELLDGGADVNATNESGATALIWGTGSLAKVKLLVEKGADVNSRSKLGKTALLVASSRDGAAPVVSYLLAHGARTDVVDDAAGIPLIPIGGGGASVLIQAAKARDGQALSEMLKRGLDVNAKEKNGATALLNAVASHNGRNVQTLLAAGADVNAANAAGFTPLMMAAMWDDYPIAAALVAKGAKIDGEDIGGNTALMWASLSERANPEIVSLLLKTGANPDHANKMGETAGTWALRRGTSTQVVALLKPPSAPALAIEQLGPVLTATSFDKQHVSAAIDKSLPLLQKGGQVVFKQRGCVSCHNNVLPTMAAVTARNQGHKIDDAAIERERKELLSVLKPVRELLAENGDNLPDIAVSVPYLLMSLAAQDYPADVFTDAAVHNLASKQNIDGSWSVWAPRPPIEYGDIQATALSVRALQLYPLGGRREEWDSRFNSAREWLSNARSQITEDLNWKLLGLQWTKADSRQVGEAAQLILRNQRADGGWAQLPGLESDAYATGQTLHALSTAHVIDTESEPWKRGVEYLLRTQAADGTWHVQSRAFPFQPYFESGFPYGRDQWISEAGTSWATLALELTEANTTPSQLATLK